MSRGRGRVDFEGDRPEEEPLSSAIPTSACTIDWAYPSLTVLIEGKSLTWYFDEYPRRGLALEVMHIIKGMVEAGSYFDTYQTFGQYRSNIGSILRNIDLHDPSRRVNSLKDMDRAFFDVLDHEDMRISEWSRLQQLILVVRAARKFEPTSVATDLVSPLYGDRLSYVSRYGKPKTNPRDWYSPNVAAQIQAAARTDILKTTDRVRGG